jgi:(E)-4-hydroxy-3-methylbut-2-enyl-diphosphate synthase
MVSARRVMVGSVMVGGGAPISVQSMLKCDPHDAKASLRQLKRLERCGCQIVRMAIPDQRSIPVLAGLVKQSSTPLVADIHFQPRLALLAIDAGVAKVRINPGNMTRSGQVQVLKKAAEAGIPLRVGLNSGSLPKGLLASDLPGQLVEGAERFLLLAGEIGFERLVVSLKASCASDTIEANRRFSQRHENPLHIGLTEAGPLPEGLVHSVLACQPLLAAGIGDTLRISLSAPPETEVLAAFALLEGMDLRPSRLRLVSCPTCGRTRQPLAQLLSVVRRLSPEIQRTLTVAVMGCEVNGPGEAAAADLGLIWIGKKIGLFRDGTLLRTVERRDLLPALRQEIARLS